MLPSRGAFRSLPLYRAQYKNLLPPPPGARRFGTAQVRSNGGALVGLSARAGTSGRIAGAGFTTATAGVLVAHVGWLGFPARAQAPRQIRHASTQPVSEAVSSSSSSSSSSSAVATPLSTPPLSDSFIDPADFAATGSQLLDMTEQIGYLKALGLDFGWGPTSMVQWALEHIHVWSGLPWWASIAVFGVATRLLFVPISIRAMEMAEKTAVLKQNPKFAAATEKMMAQLRSGGTMDLAGRIAAQTARMEVKHMQREAGVKPYIQFLPMLQLPIGLGFFRLMHSAVALPVPGLETGGILWLQNLTLSDPFFVMPFVSGALMYKVLSSGVDVATEPQQAAMMKILQYVLVPISVLATLKLSAALQIYIIVTSFFQMVQSWLLRKPLVRKMVGLEAVPPQAPSKPGVWSPPRTISTTATVHGSSPVSASPSAQPTSASEMAGVNSGNPITNFKNALAGTRQKFNSYTQQGRAKRELSMAEQLEKRRADEEAQKFQARREEALRKRRSPGANRDE